MKVFNQVFRLTTTPVCRHLGLLEKVLKDNGAKGSMNIFLWHKADRRWINPARMATDLVQPFVVAFFGGADGDIRQRYVLFERLLGLLLNTLILMCLSFLVRWNFQASGEGEDNYRLGLTSLHFSAPESRSLRNRPELDSVVKDHLDLTINATQKPVEVYRWINRHFLSGKSSVLSVCDGTGSATVAAAADGHNVVGVDYSTIQHLAAKQRLNLLTNLEECRISMLHGTEEEQKKAALKFCTILKKKDGVNTADLTAEQVEEYFKTVEEEVDAEHAAGGSTLSPGPLAVNTFEDVEK